jgi:hypothetical protein
MIPNTRHKGLSADHWREMSLEEQLANVGSEVIRSINWKERNEEYSRMAAERALELLCFTIDDPKHRRRLRELTRLYEVLVNDLYGFDDYEPNLKGLESYFVAFTYAASIQRQGKRNLGQALSAR